MFLAIDFVCFRVMRPILATAAMEVLEGETGRPAYLKYDDVVSVVFPEHFPLADKLFRGARLCVYACTDLGMIL